MSETTPSPLEQELLGIKNMLWGPHVRPEIFKRWSQGFYFSASEPTALEQSQGGPCAVIAPVQAFILKNLLSKHRDLSFRTKSNAQNPILINALGEILQQCDNATYYIVYLNNNCDRDGSNSSAGVVGDECNGDLSDAMSGDYERFHNNLKVITFVNVDDVKKYYLDNVEQLTSQFGILLFLYSLLATRRLERVQSDNSNDTSEPLIDNIYGYGSQSLINLMVTGRATTYVWDHDQDVGGLKLKGLEKQSEIGFITLMEHLRFCTVGSFYKNPTHPVWVMASDTHLTVLFSTERRLVSPETKSDQARRVFRHFDPDGNNFISSSLLQDVLQSLDLVSEEAYVDIMRRKLDPENLGIILLNAFMEEFFPREDNTMPDLFPLVHYNGLPQSNHNGQIKYRVGECVLLESDLRAEVESNAMLTVLQTKWPSIEIRWTEEGGTPSLN